MNEERYILARLIRELIRLEEESEKEKNYRTSFHSEEICLIIEKIRADAILGEPEQFLPWDEEVK